MKSHKPVVVVTGASAGVGRATARAFSRKGYAVGLLARGMDGLEAARREIEACGGQAIVLKADVADDREVEAAAAAAEDSKADEPKKEGAPMLFELRTYTTEAVVLGTTAGV